jgi:hypothetical protein
MAGPVTPNETVPIRQIVINAIISCHPAHTIVGDSDNCVSHLSLNHSMPYWPMSFSLSICVIWCAPCTHTHTHTQVLYYFDQMFTGCYLSPQMFIPRQSWKSYHIWQSSECQTEHFGFFFFAYLGHKNEKSPSPRPKMFSS